MAPPTIKKRRLSSPSRDHRNKTYPQDIAGSEDEGSSYEESEVVPANGAIRSRHTILEARGNATISWSSGTCDSNMFKLKANELLAKVRPDYARQAENLLRKLKDIIERIPDREAKLVRNISVHLI